MKRKEAVYKGLEFVDVYYEDSSLTSPDYFQITEFPIRLTSGKNLFKLKGHPTNLRVGGYLNLEVLDYNGDPIYHEIIDYIDEDKSRVIAIYIYSDSSPGDCSITLLAEATVVNNVPVPIDWQGRPNVRWTRTVPVNPTISNDSEIIFKQLPVISIREQVAAHLDRSYPGNEQFPTYSTGTIRYFSNNGAPVIELSGGSFTSDMKTGTINVSTPINALPIPNYTPGSISYISTIKKILTPTTALLDTEYIVYSSQSISTHTFNAFDNSAFTLKYEATPTYTETENSESYALVEIKELQPATGDVSRVKMYMNNNGTVGTWEPIIDVELDETEIFVINTGSLFPDKSVGAIESQTVINTYWEGHTYLGKTESTAPTLTYTSIDIDNAINVISTVDISGAYDAHILQVKSGYSGLFLENSSYKVTFDAIGTRSIYSANQNPVIAVYLSGSAFNYNATDAFNRELPIPLGKRIGRIEVTSDSKRYDDQVFSFDADVTGNGVLLFVIESGDWKISDIRTTTDNDSGYTPNYTRLKALIPTSHKIGNQLTFKIEYYNVAGVKSKQTNYIYNLDWEGGNRYVDGNYSMLTGSLYVADSLNSGVAISGYPNSGFIRSLGYEGFNAGFAGFLLWSGSAMPSSTTTYQGVGLELYADTDNYFRYRTNPSELIVKTQKFFLGSTSPVNFISGSNGNIEISSSAFHLNPNGSVTASSFLAVNGNTVLFDSNNEYADALNIGRVVYFDQSEYTYNIANLPITSSGITGSVFAGPSFHAFILPGESNMQISYTFECDRTDLVTGGRTISLQAFIANAITGSNDGLTSYDKFDNQANMATITIVSPPSGSQRSGADTRELKGSPGATTLTDRQGTYVLVHTMIRINNNPGTLTGTFKMKNFVFRTSRTAGGSIVPSLIIPGVPE